MIDLLIIGGGPAGYVAAERAGHHGLQVVLFEKKSMRLKECFEVQPIVRDDFRGRFIKTFHKVASENLGLPMCYAEEYYSTSYQWFRTQQN